MSPNDLLNWLFDFHQEGRILEVDAKGAETRSRVTQLGDEQFTLEQRHERLKLVTAALWHVLREHTGLTNADLRRAIMEVDGRDGRIDNRMTPSKDRIECQSCGRTILKSAVRCVYCGTTNAQSDGFHGT